MHLVRLCQGPVLGQQGIPDRQVLAIAGTSCRGQDTAGSQKGEISRNLVVAGERQERLGPNRIRVKAPEVQVALGICRAKLLSKRIEVHSMGDRNSISISDEFKNESKNES